MNWFPIFVFTLATSVVFIFTGFFLGKKKILDFQLFKNARKFLADPVTRKLHERLHAGFADHIRNKNGFVLFIVIFVNNLFLGALVGRTLYGIVFFLPWLLTAWGSLGRGVVYSKIGLLQLLNPIGLFEFLAYLFASAAGIRFGLDLLSCLAARSFQPLAGTLTVLLQVYPVVIVLLFIGALLEARLLVKFPVPENFTYDRKTMEKNMENMLK